MVQVCWAGEIEAGRTAIEPLRGLAELVGSATYVMPYPGMYSFTAAAMTPIAMASRSMYANELNDAAVDAMLDAMRQATSPISMVQLRGLGGAMARVGEDETAFANRICKYFVAVLGLWLDAGEDGAPHRAWAQGLWEALRPCAQGVYVNFLGDEGADRVHDAYPSATFERLAKVKRAYDPANMFRFNQNIRPAVARTGITG
jgi:hypothetical protein